MVYNSSKGSFTTNAPDISSTTTLTSTSTTWPTISHFIVDCFFPTDESWNTNADSGLHAGTAIIVVTVVLSCLFCIGVFLFIRRSRNRSHPRGGVILSTPRQPAPGGVTSYPGGVTTYPSAPGPATTLFYPVGAVPGPGDCYVPLKCHPHQGLTELPPPYPTNSTPQSYRPPPPYLAPPSAIGAPQGHAMSVHLSSASPEPSSNTNQRDNLDMKLDTV